MPIIKIKTTRKFIKNYIMRYGKNMTKEELIKDIETMRENIINALSYVNAKHDILVNELCYINNLLSRARGDEDGRSTE